MEFRVDEFWYCVDTRFQRVLCRVPTDKVCHPSVRTSFSTPTRQQPTTNLNEYRLPFPPAIRSPPSPFPEALGCCYVCASVIGKSPIREASPTCDGQGTHEPIDRENRSRPLMSLLDHKDVVTISPLRFRQGQEREDVSRCIDMSKHSCYE